MNIDSSNLLSMLSSGESLESIQQLLPGDGAESVEFSDALMQKIEQLQGLSASVEGSDKLVIENLNLGKQLHQIADLSQTAEQINDFSAFLGKDLPQQNLLEKNIDLENTLETLASVLNTLDEGVETKVDIDTQIEASIETIKAIKQYVPEQSEIVAKLDQIVAGLEQMKPGHHLSREIDNKSDTSSPIDDSIDLEQQALKNLEQKVEGSESIKPDLVNVEITDESVLSLEIGASSQEQNQFNFLDVEEPESIKPDKANTEDKELRDHSSAIETSNQEQNQFNFLDVEEPESIKLDKANIEDKELRDHSSAIETSNQEQNQINFLDVEEPESIKLDKANIEDKELRDHSSAIKTSNQEQNQINFLDVEEPEPIKPDKVNIEDKEPRDHSSAIESSSQEQKQFNISDPMVGEQKEVIQQVASNEFEQKQVRHVDNIVENVKQLESLLQEQPVNNDSEAINTVDKENKTALASEVEQLVLGIESIKETISNKITEALNKQQVAVEDLLQSVDKFSTSSENQIETEVPKEKSPEKIELSVDNEEQLMSFLEEDLDEADIENRMASIVATLNESKQFDKAGVQSQAIYQELKMGGNKENLSTKQILEQQSIDFSVKPEVKDELLQQNDAMMKMKPTDIDSVLSKQNQNSNVLQGKDVELTTERVLPKFATDIANLNRAVMVENKAEIPAMTKHFANPEWNKEIGERVIWMHKQAIPSAELRLNPGHLGPINIKIDMSQDQATVAFTTQHAAVKEAIDAALPKLREMFSAQQLNLAEVSVSQEDAGQKQQRGFSQMGSGAGKGEKDSNEMLENEFSENSMHITDEIEAGRAIASNGILSIYA